MEGPRTRPNGRVMLGQREPSVYGSASLADVEASCRDLAAGLDLEVEFSQSNAEHVLVEWIQQAREDSDGIIINPAAYTQTSVAILDALNMFDGPVIEVHISEVHKREQFRQRSYVSRRANGVIKGCGVEGYELALRRMATLLNGSNPD